jgi:hypothetical protein
VARRGVPAFIPRVVDANQPRTPPLISRLSPWLIGSVFVARFARLGPLCGVVTSTKFTERAA